MKFNGRAAVVTGAASGIGLGIAEALAKAGARVLLADIAAEKAQAEAQKLRQQNLLADAYTLDVTNGQSIAAFVAAAAKLDTPVDIIVNAAGWDRIQPFLENTSEFMDRVLAINLRGPVGLTQKLVPAMAAAGYGKIVNVASDAGRVGSLGETVYAGAKGGMIAFTKSLAREVARYHITVNCVCPGPTDTPLFAAQPEKVRLALEKAIPFRRIAQPQEIANAILFFASARSDYVTAQVLSVSGGLTMVG